MEFAEDFRRFIAPDAERLVALAGMLASRGLPYSVIRTGETRHLALRVGRGAPSLILIAHYDRVAGSPGVLDNSCACLELADFAATVLHSGASSSPSFLIVFTDGEEAPGWSGDVSSQGSFGLAQALAVRSVPPLVLVFDVTGRGDRLLLSSAPAELLARAGRGEGELASAHGELVGLARRAAKRAGLKEPLSLPLPWSDDLGLLLGGMGALTVSLLPEEEASLLSRGGSPPTWALLHSPKDAPEAAEEASLALMASFLEALALELPLSPALPEK